MGGMPGLDASGRFEHVREAWSFASAEGVKLTSDHYILYTTCTSKPFVDALPGFLETCWHAYADLSEEDFSTQAAAVTDALAKQSDPPLNSLVLEAFVDEKSEGGHGRGLRDG